MCYHGRVFAPLRAQRPKARRLFIIGHFLRGGFAIKRCRQRTSLYSPYPQHANIIILGRADNVSRFCGFLIATHTSRTVHQIAHGLHNSGLFVCPQGVHDRLGKPGAGDPPICNQAFFLKALKCRNNLALISRPACSKSVLHICILVVAVIIRTDIAVQKKEVRPLDLHRFQGPHKRCFHPLISRSRRRRADLTLGCEPRSFWWCAVKRFAKHALCFPATIHRRRIKKRNPGIRSKSHRGDSLFAAGLTPDLCHPTTAKREAAHRPECTKHGAFQNALL